MSANVSYQRAAQDIAVLTGMAVSRGTQQRLVQQQSFKLPVVKNNGAIEQLQDWKHEQLDNFVSYLNKSS